jgi:Protein of unknown function (DUF1571)
MIMNPVPLGGFPKTVRARKRRWLVAMGALGLAVPWAEAAPPRSREPGNPVDRHIIQTKGPDAESSPPPEARPVSSLLATEPDAPRVASVVNHHTTHPTAHEPAPGAGATTGAAPAAAETDPIRRAQRAIAECQERYRHIYDYTCTFMKRERIDGRLTPYHVMTMKARTNPTSIYFKFQKPNRGREAIYVQGRNDGRIVAHDVGLGKFLAGTMHLDPRGSMAMEENRHPVTEAGIGALIDTVAKHWTLELKPGESVVTFHPNSRVGNHPCTMIETVHPKHGPNYLFHKVKLYIDQEHGLPIRFEAYDWPKHPNAAPELVEEYTYLDLRTNVGLRDHDFDPSNAQYSFGRF